jgi:transcriptional regulator with GAF, ATPase, and Fis domain
MSIAPTNMIGDHASIRKIQEIIKRVAPTDATVLITGESGTGKELVARAIHTASPRAARPFVPVNCAAIPENLLESELFGHVRGAFTGAHSSRLGMFQLANHGTIFLDEVGELPLALQAKLLRVLQDGEVRPVGTDHSVAVQVRVIAATNKELAHQVEKGSFREDLFFRLQVIPIHLPPLRARRSDIPILTEHFLDKANKKHGLSVIISREAMIYLWEYDWPGNIRELENLVERLVILSETGVTEGQDLPANIRSYVTDKKNPKTSVTGEQVDFREATDQLQLRLMDEALRLTNGNKSAAAKILGLKRTTLVAKLRKQSGRAKEESTADVDDRQETFDTLLASGQRNKER